MDVQKVINELYNLYDKAFQKGNIQLSEACSVQHYLKILETHFKKLNKNNEDYNQQLLENKNSLSQINSNIKTISNDLQLLNKSIIPTPSYTPITQTNVSENSSTDGTPNSEK